MMPEHPGTGIRRTGRDESATGSPSQQLKSDL